MITLLTGVQSFATVHDAKTPNPNPIHEKEIQAQKINSAFLSSQKSYNVYKFLFKQDRKVLNEAIVADPMIKGFFRFKDPNYLQKLDSCLHDSLVMDLYDIEGFSCVNTLVHDVLPIDKCKMFVVVYKPLLPSLPPVIAIKGTSGWGDLVEDIFRKGGGYLKQLLDPVNALVPGFETAKKAVEDSIHDAIQKAYDGFSHDASLNRQYVEALNAYAARYPDHQLLFTGHSLGGSLASNLADAYTKSQPPGKHARVDLITFNSLSPEVTLNYFYKNNDLKNKKASLNNADIRGVHIRTYDDPLQYYNKMKKAGHFGGSVLLSSGRNLNSVGKAEAAGIDGHYMASIGADIDFTRNVDESKAVLQTALDSIKSGTATQRVRDVSLSEQEELKQSYEDHMKADRGASVIPLHLQALDNSTTAFVLGSPRKIGEVSKGTSLRKTPVYDLESKLLGVPKKGCENFEP
jgi:hypothetical protein